MGDLDFEELDRAINDLSAELDRQAEPEPTPAPKPKPKKVTPKADVVVVKKKPVAAKAMKGHSNGHFMDMVHPSSDAQVQHKHNFADERQAKIDAAKKLAEEESNSDGEVEVSKPKKSSKITILTDNEPTVDNVEENKVVEELAPVKTAPRRRAVKISNDNQRTKHDLAQPLPTIAKSATTTEAVAAASYETPFLPDVKVEKKPLGSVRSTNANHRVHDSVSPNASTKSELDIETDKYKDEIDNLVAELHDNLAKPIRAPRHQKKANGNSQKNKAAKPSKNEARKWLRIVGYAIAVIGIVAAGVLLGLFFYYYGF